MPQKKKKTMITIIENPIKEKRKDLNGKSKAQSSSHAVRQDRTQTAHLVKAGLAIAGLLMTIIMSVMLDGLFLKELVVSSLIILMVLVLKLEDSKMANQKNRNQQKKFDLLHNINLN